MYSGPRQRHACGGLPQRDDTLLTNVWWSPLVGDCGGLFLPLVPGSATLPSLAACPSTSTQVRDDTFFLG